MQSIEWMTIWVLVACFGLGPLWFGIQNKYQDWQADVINTLMIFVLSWWLIVDGKSLWVWIVGIVIGYVSDYLGVYNKYWQYKSKSGYCWWVGAGWGLVSLISYNLQAANWLVPGVLLILAVGILGTRKILMPRSEIDAAFLIVKALGVVVAPVLFAISFSWGVIIEYVGVEIFETWKYKSLSYLHIGLGYAMVLTIVKLFIEGVGGGSLFGKLYLGVLVIGYTGQILWDVLYRKGVVSKTWR